jgi:hypothetical protein
VWRVDAGDPGISPTITIWRYSFQMLNSQLHKIFDERRAFNLSISTV